MAKQQPEYHYSADRRITSISRPAPKLLVLDNGGADAYGRTAALVELLVRDSSLTVQWLGIDRPARQWWRIVSEAVKAADAVQLVALSTRDLYARLLPAVVLARFWGKPTGLHFESDPVVDESPWQLRRLRCVVALAEILTASTGAAAERVRQCRVGVRVLPACLSMHGVSSRRIRSVQPKALCVVSPDEPGAMATAGRAIDLVKQKYPRAEMTIAVASKGDPTTEVRHDFGREAVPSSFTTVDQLTQMMAEADLYIDLSLRRAPIPLLYAQLAGLPVVALRLPGDQLLHDENALLLETDDFVALADTIVAMVERPEVVARYSEAGKAVQHEYDIDMRSRAWQDHLERLRSRQM
ncbi:glycosyltransferase [candidate division GN15 bacterium]|nr:glycosyltransferase [candidate division GN15 bacterium]